MKKELQTISVKQLEGGIFVIGFKDMVIANDSAIEKLGEELLSLECTQRVVVNFQGVSLFSSEAIGKLLEFAKKREPNFETKLPLCSLSDDVQNSFATKHLDVKFFELFSSLEDVIQWYN